jgi:hypothetical protein
MIPFSETNIVLASFLLTSAYFLIRFFSRFRLRKRIKRHGETTEGEIVALATIEDPEYSDSPQFTTYEPLIHFRTSQGLAATVQYSHSHQTKWKVGMRLQLRYLPANPQQFIVLDYELHDSERLIVLMLIAGSVLFISICCCFI